MIPSAREPPLRGHLSSVPAEGTCVFIHCRSSSGLGAIPTEQVSPVKKADPVQVLRLGRSTHRTDDHPLHSSSRIRTYQADELNEDPSMSTQGRVFAAGLPRGTPPGRPAGWLSTSLTRTLVVGSPGTYTGSSIIHHTLQMLIRGTSSQRKNSVCFQTRVKTPS